MTGSEPTKILLIEDNPGDARLIQEMLAEVSGFSFHMECVDCLSTGLERLAKRGIDLVLLDLSLPDSQGLDTFAKIKAQTQGIPIVVLSGHADEEWAVMSVKDGAQDYLVKGQVDSKPLARSIRYAIERHNLQARLDYVAHYDTLTGLPNRILFQDLLRQTIAGAKYEKRQFAVLHVFIGRLSSICELLGREVCNTLFNTVTKRLRDGVHESGVITYSAEEDAATIGRIGEYEFTVLLSIIGAQHAASVSQKILKAFSESIILDDNKFFLTCHIGIAVYPPDGGDEKTLLQNATLAMMHVRNRGENDFQFYSPEIGTRAFERITLENGLIKALEQNELAVHYQPQADLRTGKIVGMEALVRWQHPGGRLVPPAEFLPLAEETGLITSIDKWVLKTACRQNRAWYDMRPAPITTYMSVNTSASRIHHINLIETATTAIKETGLTPRYLGLEITENTLMSGKGTAIAAILALKEIGINTLIDDFGTGYSSLSQLKRLPINGLKIDKSFVHDIKVDPNADAIVAAIIAMAHILQLKVIAEGIETKVQLEFLRSLNCDEMQGYLLSPPLPAEEATKLLAEGRQLEL